VSIGEGPALPPGIVLLGKDWHLSETGRESDGTRTADVVNRIENSQLVRTQGAKRLTATTSYT
jgi:hypothetical protein